MSPKIDRLYAGVTISETVYNESGKPLGTVRGVDADGFYVLGSERAPKTTIAEALEITERDHVMWRCWECGAMDQTEGSLPSNCPDCGAPREDLYYYVED
jgi:Zn finger protein HypA/HybF involved in hydrogenase expression